MEEYTVKVNQYGNKYWYQNDKLHRLDGPAVEYADGGTEWYQNDMRHRLDGPACEYASGDKFWYQNDKLHRLDGPAFEEANGSKSWCQNGKLHRLDGPAIEDADGYKAWYIEGKQLTEEEFNEAVYSKKRTRRRRKIDYGDLTEEQYEQRKRKYTQDIIDGVCGIGINFITWMDSCGYKHEGRFKFIRKEQRYNKVEVTLEDIAKAINIDVDKLRIKGTQIKQIKQIQ